MDGILNCGHLHIIVTTLNQKKQHHLKTCHSNLTKSVNIAKITKSETGIQLSIYDENLNLLESDSSYADNYTLNFYLQTLPRKYNVRKALLIIHDKNKNSVDMFIADDENSFFIS